jgi:hypothetical protein
MKLLLLSLFLVLGSAQMDSQQQVETIVGTYEGKSNQIYVFSIGRQGSMQFKQVSDEVMATTNLDNTALIGGLYEVSFTQVPSAGHDDFERTIVGLRIIQ